MAGPGLPTGVVAGGTGHVSHTNAVHGIVNQFDTTLSASTAGHAILTDGTTFDNRALLSTDIPSVTVNSQTGTSYTLVLADAGKVVERSNASANTLTVPPNSSVAFPVGTVISWSQEGAGLTTIVQGSGVTITSRGGLLASAGQYAEGTLRKRATDSWRLTGDIA